MPASIMHGGVRLTVRFSTAVAVSICVVVLVAIGSLSAFARPDAFGGASFHATPEFLPYTEQQVLPPDAHALGVYLASEKPGAVKHGGRALLSDEQTPGKTVLIERDGTLYQLSHQ